MTPVPHDFRKPLRLQALWHNRLSSWFRAALSLASKSWEKQFGPGIDATFKDLSTAFAHDALARLPDGTLGYEIRIDEPRLTSILAMPRSLMLGFIGILLGSADGAAEDRELTLVEENLADYLQTQLWLPSFCDTWPDNEVVSWKLEGVDAQPQCSRLFPAAEVLVCLEFSIKGPWGESNGAWLFPQKTLLERLDPNHSHGDAIAEKDLSARRESIVQSLPMQVNIALGTASLTLADLSNLRVGDVVLLDQRTTENVTAHAGGRQIFQGQPGRLGSWRAVQIDKMRVQ